MEVDVESRQSVVRYLRALADKELAELFYEATRERPSSDVAEARRHFVLGDASLDDGAWSVEVISPADEAHGPWAAGVPICQSGTCDGCGLQIRSWAKHMLCSVCGTKAYGS